MTLPLLALRSLSRSLRGPAAKRRAPSGRARGATFASALLVAIALASPVRATATYTCEVEAEGFSFAVIGYIGGTDDDGLRQVKGDLRLSIEGTPDDLKAVSFTSEMVRRAKVAGPRVDLLLRMERGAGRPFGRVNLAIETRFDATTDYDYPGTYTLTVAYRPAGKTGAVRTIERSGKLVCQAG